MNDDHDIRRRLLDELHPTPASVERIRRRIPSDAPARRPALSRFGAARVRIGVAVSITVALAAAVALSPFDRDSSRSLVPAPTTARAALERAALAAGDERWTPLEPGQYHHLMTTSFAPRVPTSEGDPRSKIDRMLGLQGPESTETWIDPYGDGFSLIALGGNGDPKMYPTVTSSNAGAVGFSPTVGRQYPKRDTVSTTDSLRLADMVRAERIDGTRGDMSMWFRTSDGYERKSRQVGQTGNPEMSFREFNQRRRWGVTYEAVAAVNAATPDELDAAIVELIDTPNEGFGGTLAPQRQYGVGSEQVQEEERIQRAVELLGAAPLSPSARRALFDWLAARPMAKLIGDATDEMGRHGTRVTLERVNSRTVPSHTVTQAQMRAEWAKSHGGVQPKRVVGPNAVVVKEDHQYRRWYVSIIFDPTTGELLQSELYGRQETTAQRPRISYGRVRFSVDRQGMTDGLVYGTRERATDFDEPLTVVCKVTPTMCTAR